MFNNMKNKIKEKTGSEVPKFVTKSSHSRRSSQSSLNSMLSDHSQDVEKSPNLNGVKNNAVNECLETPMEDMEPQKFLQKEREWIEKEKAYVEDLLKKTEELDRTCSLLEEGKKKYQLLLEEKEQLESFQKQELSRIKELLLNKEAENESNAKLLKETSANLETAKEELSRLRPLEEKMGEFQNDLECLRHTSEKERWTLSSQLARKEEEIKNLEDRVAVLTQRTEADCQALGAQLSTDERVRSLIAERSLMERKLEESRVHLYEIKTSWSEKISKLETQVERLGRQAGEEGVERRSAEDSIRKLRVELSEKEREVEGIRGKLEAIGRERDELAKELKKAVGAYDDANLEELKRENESLKRVGEETQVLFNETIARERGRLEELNAEMAKLRGESEEANEALRAERDANDGTIFRNAELSQKLQMAAKEIETLTEQNEDLTKRMGLLERSKQEEDNSRLKLKEENGRLVSEMRAMGETMKALEDESWEKSKVITKLQQNLLDMKKTLQAELKQMNESAACCNDVRNKKFLEDDVNFKYMKNVLMKFLTGSDYEAQQLTKVVATLLSLNSEEEKLVRETLEWRTSWFGARPKTKPFNHHTSSFA